MKFFYNLGIRIKFRLSDSAPNTKMGKENRKDGTQSGTKLAKSQEVSSFQEDALELYIENTIFVFLISSLSGVNRNSVGMARLAESVRRVSGRA